jgi:hypothetical protein
MKPVIIIVLVLIFAGGCAVLPTGPERPQQTPPGFFLRYALSPGLKLRYLLRTEYESQLPGGEDAKVLSVQQETDFEQTVVEVLPDGKARVALSIVRLRLVLSQPESDPIVFDSEAKEDPFSGVPLEVEGIAFLMGKKIEFEQLPSGEIVGVSGLADIYRDALDELSEEQRGPVDRLLRRIAHYPRLLLGLGPVFPKQEVRLGDSWTTRRGPFPILLGEPLYFCTYTLAGVSRGQAAIGFQGEMEIPGSISPSGTESVKEASIRGTLFFDAQQGVVVTMHGESSSALRIGSTDTFIRKGTWDLSL